MNRRQIEIRSRITLLSFRAKSRNPVAKSRVSPRDSSTLLRSARN